MGKVVKQKRVSTDVRGVLKAPKRKGYIQQKGERGTGLKFKLETFATVTKFQPGTRIKYGPNPKRPDSKSYKRYAKYQKAATVGESLKFGAKVADFLWELERGDYKVLGSVRSEAAEVAAIGKPAYERCKRVFSSFQGPNGLMRDLNDPKAAEALKKEDAWRAQKLKRCEALAHELNLSIETPAQIEAAGESADVRLQRRVADAIAAKKLATGKAITHADMTEVLQLWGFCQNVGRLNVLPEGVKYVYSDTIGAIRARSRGFGITPPTRRYPNFPRILNKFLADNKPKVSCKFVCTAININANYAGRRHRDQNNEGPSAIRAFGKFKGGRLHYWPRDVKKPRPAVESLDKKHCVTFDLAKNTTLFDGRQAHEVEPFDGERYSIVFFTARGYGKTKANDVKTLKSCGFPWPSPQDLNKLKRASATA